MWQLRQDAESTFSTNLPIEDSVTERAQPWLLHSLDVNALNFCSFAMYQSIDPKNEVAASRNDTSILVATPGVQDGWINVTSLPSEERIAIIPGPKDTKTGMIMAIGLCYDNEHLMVLAGYESGHAVVWQQEQASRQWQIVYMNKSHTQPILSLDITLDKKSFLTSSADAIIAKHPLQEYGSSASKTLQTRHAGQQSLNVRSDGKVFATAGWDGRLRVYSPKSMKELAVLKWHKEGCYALAFAEVTKAAAGQENESEAKQGDVKPELTISEQRIAKAASGHWLAAGSKDGKISLWDIY